MLVISSRRLPSKSVQDGLPGEFTNQVSMVIRGRSWAKKSDRVRCAPKQLPHAKSPDEFQIKLNQALNHKKLQGSKDGLVVMPFIVTRLGRNFIAHSLADDGGIFREELGKTLDAVVIAITYTWKLAQELWLEQSTAH